jgi:hypothetical protein
VPPIERWRRMMLSNGRNQESNREVGSLAPPLRRR